MSAKDHPNNAPGVPMIFPPWFENFQVKYFNPALKPIARYLPGTRRSSTAAASPASRTRPSSPPTVRATCWRSRWPTAKRTG